MIGKGVCSAVGVPVHIIILYIDTNVELSFDLSFVYFFCIMYSQNSIGICDEGKKFSCIYIDEVLQETEEYLFLIYAAQYYLCQTKYILKMFEIVLLLEMSN